MRFFYKTLRTVIIIIAVTSISLNLYSQVNLDSALIGYYPFNGNANDESFNSYDGEVSGAVLTSDRNGNLNSAYQFDGNNDYITTAANIYGGYEGSISAWIYIDSLKERLPIFSQGDFYSNYNSLRLTIWDDSLSFIVDYRDCGDTEDYPTIKAKTQIPVSEWVHVVVTSDSLVHKLYVNGVLYDYRTVIPAQGEWFGNLCDETRDTYIGAWFRTDNDEYFKGKIDEVRIYEREINQDEVLALYNETTNNVNSIKSNYNIKVFPNPTKNYINVNSNAKIIFYEIYDTNGKIVLQNKPNDLKFTVNITSLPAGTYLMKLNTKYKTIYKKIIK